MKVSTVSLLTFFSFFLSCNLVCATYCPEVTKPITTVENAKKCAQARFKDARKDKLFNFGKEHQGNIVVAQKVNCNSDLGENSYFANTEELFYTAVEGITITSCMVDNKHIGKYRCIGSTVGPACYRKGRPTKRIAAAIAADTGEFTTFYPTEQKN
jgi:hypothetical protein